MQLTLLFIFFGPRRCDVSHENSFNNLIENIYLCTLVRGVYTLQVDFASQQLERYLEGREAGPQFHNKNIILTLQSKA